MGARKSGALAALAGLLTVLVLAPLLADEPPLPGDTDLDDDVDFADYQTLEANYGTGSSWAQGDFDGDGDVDFADYQTLELNFGKRRLSANLTITNNTGSTRTNWPVFLTVWKAFGGNLPLGEMNPDGFHLYDSGGTEIPHMLRILPPEFSLGAAEIVFIVPSISSGASQTYRVTNTPQTGLRQTFDLIGNANNRLPNGGFETDSGGVPTGYTITANSGTTIAFDTAEKVSGSRSLRLTMPMGSSVTIKTASTISFTSGRRYHFSIWAKTDNVAYNGYGFSNMGGWFTFDSQAFNGRTSLTLRDDRPWFNYRFDPGSNDSWGVPAMGPTGRSTMSTRFVIAGYQANQQFLRPPRTGTIWIDEALLFEQPTVTVDRSSGLARIARSGAVVFARPVEMPQAGACPHEAVSRLSAYAMRGERRQVRFGVHAVTALSNLQVEVSALAGPGASIGGGNLDLERLGTYVEDYQAVASLAAGSAQEYILGIDVPDGQAPGTYMGAITIRAGGSVIRTLPLELEVLPADLPDLEGYWVGGIYNVGFPLPRDDDFYRCYGKVRFNYLMLFDYFCTHVDQMGQDFAYAQQQVDKLAALARVTGGIGLYREPNMSEDQPRMWYQMATGDPTWPGKWMGTDPAYEDGYQDYAEACQTYAVAHNWPTMIYMVSDEPDRAADKVDYMGWLNERLPEAITCCDAQFADMIATWQWYNLPILDDPVDWTGPLMYDYVRAHEGRFGFCGKATGLESGRYQPGLMLASSGAIYLHWWHTSNDSGTGPFAVVGGKTVRMHHIAAMAAGVTDLRYYVMLKQLIDLNRTGPKAAVAAEAEAYLNSIFAFATADHDRHNPLLLPYNGTPYTWGCDRFYDDWQRRMKDYALQLTP